MRNAVLQGSSLEPILFNLFITALEETYSLQMTPTSERPADTLEGRAVFQTDPKQAEETG